MILTKAVALIAMAVAGNAAGWPEADIAGDWKGALKVNATTLRLVLHVASASDGWSATLDSVDQAAPGIPVDRIRRNGERLEFEMKILDARYEGVWIGAAGEFQGKWRQGAAEFPLSWKRDTGGGPKRDPMTEEERRFLVQYLEKTRDDLVQSVSGVSAGQWTYKPDPGRWSLAECVEHLIIEERTLFPAITQKVVRIPLPEERARAGRQQDERIIRFMTDRSSKVAAAESVQPRGGLASAAEGVSQFAKARDESSRWVRETRVDLREFGTAVPTFEYLDAYEYFILLAAHSARHTAQIEEVKHAAGYPRN